MIDAKLAVLASVLSFCFMIAGIMFTAISTWEHNKEQIFISALLAVISLVSFIGWLHIGQYLTATPV